MNSIWNKNFAAFKERFPQLAELTGCQPVSPEAFWKLENAKNGMITASEGSVRLHSAYNPEREAYGAVRREEVFTKSAIVFYGFGLGYHIIECAKLILEKNGNKLLTPGDSECPRLILIEPDTAHFYAAMCVLDWTSVFKVQNLVIAIGAPAESILSFLEDVSGVNIGETGVSDAYYFDIPAFTAHAESYFDVVRSIIRRNQRKNEINAATLKKFGRLWCHNSIKNLEQMKKLPGIMELKNSAVCTGCEEEYSKSLPFLLIGAGPSLSSILPYIKDLQKRAVTVCVETSLHTLLRAGVQPDFVILTDPQFWAYRHIAGLKAPESFLITELSAYPSVFNFICKKILLCGSQFPVGQFFERQLGLTPGDLGTGGSVASCAWNFAHFCGAKEIFTAGLDLGFPEKQTHIKGSSAEQTWHMCSNRLNTPEKNTAGTLFNANVTIGKDYNNNEVLTDSRMKMFAWWFEARLANCPETKTYTLCPQGLAVPGFQKIDISQFLARPVLPESKKAFLFRIESLLPLCHSEESKIALSALAENFPDKTFFSQYPFLKEYF